jgi:hypothetical protein
VAVTPLFDFGGGPKMRNTHGGCESGVSRKLSGLPPHSTTTSNISGFQDQGVHSSVQSIEFITKAHFHVLALV